MPKTRDNSQISASTLPEAISQMNFILQRFNDRLDKIEGLRDAFEAQAGADFQGTVTTETVKVKDDDVDIHSLGNT